MLAHADKYSAAFSKDAKTMKDGTKRVSFADFEAGKYPQKDAWMYSSFWYKDFDGMAYKTMLRQLISKWGIMSIEMQNAFDNDMAVIHEDGTKDYVDTEECVVEVEEPQTKEQAKEQPKEPQQDVQAIDAAAALFS